jgi:hypothetical protein
MRHLGDLSLLIIVLLTSPDLQPEGVRAWPERVSASIVSCAISYSPRRLSAAALTRRSGSISAAFLRINIITKNNIRKTSENKIWIRKQFRRRHFLYLTPPHIERPAVDSSRHITHSIPSREFGAEIGHWIVLIHVNIPRSTRLKKENSSAALQKYSLGFTKAYCTGGLRTSCRLAPEEGLSDRVPYVLTPK